MSDSSYPPGKVTGSCACNRITFETTTMTKMVVYCYCRECAKNSGCGYLPFVHIPEANIKWSMKPDIWKSSKFAERGFCKECGSTLMMRYRGHDEIAIVRSAIDFTSEPIGKIDKHMFVGEKSGWVVIPEDDAARYDKF